MSRLDIPEQQYGFDQIYKHSDDGLAEACVKFLSKKHNKPFFLVASYDNPHNICEYARSQNLPYGNTDTPELRNCPDFRPTSPRILTTPMSSKTKEPTTSTCTPPLPLLPKTGVCTAIHTTAW